jgi:hypothetical protein
MGDELGNRFLLTFPDPTPGLVRLPRREEGDIKTFIAKIENL